MAGHWMARDSGHLVRVAASILYAGLHHTASLVRWSDPSSSFPHQPSAQSLPPAERRYHPSLCSRSRPGYFSTLLGHGRLWCIIIKSCYDLRLGGVVGNGNVNQEAGSPIGGRRHALLYARTV